MSAALDAVRAIGIGLKPANLALLQNTRLEGFGVRAFGREPILNLFAKAPISFSDAVQVLATPYGLMAMEGETAVFADLHQDRIVRLWALGETRAAGREPAICVPRDLDMSQTEGELFFDPEDHAQLLPQDVADLTTVTRSLARPASAVGDIVIPEIFSCRVFVTRAFSAQNGVAALLVLAGALDGRSRNPFTVNAALIFSTKVGQATNAKLVIDRAELAVCRENEWTPRL